MWGLCFFASQGLCLRWSIERSVKDGLISHYRKSHNDKLRVWIDALGSRLKFYYHFCSEKDVDDVEKCLINKLQPVTNILRYKNFC